MIFRGHWFVVFTNVIVIAVFELHTLLIVLNGVINVWNTLPSDHTDFSSFAAFKRTVQQIDLPTFVLCY